MIKIFSDPNIIKGFQGTFHSRVIITLIFLLFNLSTRLYAFNCEQNYYWNGKRHVLTNQEHFEPTPGLEGCFAGQYCPEYPVTRGGGQFPICDNWVCNANSIKFLRLEVGVRQCKFNRTADNEEYCKIFAHTICYYRLLGGGGSGGESSGSTGNDDESSESTFIGLPNLTPYKPSDWDDKIVVSNRKDTYTDTAIIVGEPA